MNTQEYMNEQMNKWAILHDSILSFHSDFHFVFRVIFHNKLQVTFFVVVIIKVLWFLTKFRMIKKIQLRLLEEILDLPVYF